MWLVLHETELQDISLHIFHMCIITLLPFFIEMLQYDWL
jgi:hypothetical protein